MICDRLPHPKLNEAEICIWRCDNTPLWARGSIIDALKHLISPAASTGWKNDIKKAEYEKEPEHISDETTLLRDKSWILDHVDRESFDFDWFWKRFEWKVQISFVRTYWTGCTQISCMCYNITMDHLIRTLSCVIKCTFTKTVLKNVM